jgi:hypothetical protein
VHSFVADAHHSPPMAHVGLASVPWCLSGVLSGACEQIGAQRVDLAEKKIERNHHTTPANPEDFSGQAYINTMNVAFNHESQSDGQWHSEKGAVCDDGVCVRGGPKENRTPLCQGTEMTGTGTGPLLHDDQPWHVVQRSALSEEEVPWSLEDTVIFSRPTPFCLKTSSSSSPLLVPKRMSRARIRRRTGPLRTAPSFAAFS